MDYIWNTIANLLATLVVIAIVVIPIALIVLLVIFLYKKVLGPKKNENEVKQHYTKNEPESPKRYDTGWYWNEDIKLWCPPDYQKEPQTRINRQEPTYEEWLQNRTRTADTTYHFKGSEVPNEPVKIPTQKAEHKNFYQEDTSFRSPQQPKVGYSNSYRTWDQPSWETKPNANKQPSYKEPKVGYPKSKPEPKVTPNARTAEFQNAYEATNILTKNESENYKKLKIAADKKGYIICPKVRLADIVKPRNDPQYMSRFGKIKSKHVDFVIYDENMRYLKAVIELDDSSHDRRDRQERDEFVDFILRDCGYKVIHTRYITPDILDDI